MTNIDKMISNSDFSCVGDKQLFTELTPKEAAVVEGGALLYIDRLEAVKASADTFGPDDTYITFNGNKIWGPKSFSTGQVRKVGIRKYFSCTATTRLFDRDFWLDDDPLGGFIVSSTPTSDIKMKVVSGSGSKYKVYYQVS